MLTRRTFLQLAALAATCSPAFASASSGTSLRAEVSARVEEEVLVAELTLHNDGDSDVDVMLERGSGAGIDLEGSLGGAALTPVTDLLKPEMMTRAGPRRFFLPIKAGGTIGQVGYRFRFPRASWRALR